MGECANAKESWRLIGDLRLGGEEDCSSSSSLSPSCSFELAEDAAAQTDNAEWSNAPLTRIFDINAANEIFTRPLYPCAISPAHIMQKTMSAKVVSPPTIANEALFRTRMSVLELS